MAPRLNNLTAADPDLNSRWSFEIPFDRNSPLFGFAAALNMDFA
jgi:hypothetical protein